MNILEILKEFEGIIGAILGSLFTFITTFALSRIGKLNIYLMSFEGDYWYYNSEFYGPSITKTKTSRLQCFKLVAVIDFYNSSELPKIMRNIKLVAYDKNKLLCDINITDEKTRRMTSGHYVTADDFNLCNINSRETYSLEFGAVLPKEVAEKLKNGLILKLRYRDEKNKINYFEIFKGKVEEIENKDGDLYDKLSQ